MLIVLLVACGGAGPEAADFGWPGADYAGPANRRWTFVPVVDEVAVPDGPRLLVQSTDTAWEARAGDRWRAAEAVTTWTLDRAGGLTLDNTAMLPATVHTGAVTDAAEVTATGEAEVYYGAFPDTATALVAEGAWAGEQVFALDVGPIALRWRDPAGTADAWQLATYEDVDPP